MRIWQYVIVYMRIWKRKFLSIAIYSDDGGHFSSSFCNFRSISIIIHTNIYLSSDACHFLFCTSGSPLTFCFHNFLLFTISPLLLSHTHIGCENVKNIFRFLRDLLRAKEKWENCVRINFLWHSIFYNRLHCVYACVWTMKEKK